MTTFEVTSFTAARSQEIEDSAFLAFSFVNGDLVFTRADGKLVNAGQAKGDLGDRGDPGQVTEQDLANREAGFISQINTVAGDRVALLDTVNGLQATVNGRYSRIANAISNSAANAPEISALQSRLNAQKLDFVRGSSPVIRGQQPKVVANYGMAMDDGSNKFMPRVERHFVTKSGQQEITASPQYVTGTYLGVVVADVDDVLDIQYQVDSNCIFGSGTLNIQLWGRRYTVLPGGSEAPYAALAEAPQLLINGDANTYLDGRCDTVLGRAVLSDLLPGTWQFRIYADEMGAGFSIHDHTCLSITHYRSY